jgi:hypothetical protein
LPDNCGLLPVSLCICTGKHGLKTRDTKIQMRGSAASRSKSYWNPRIGLSENRKKGTESNDGCTFIVSYVRRAPFASHFGSALKDSAGAPLLPLGSWVIDQEKVLSLLKGRTSAQNCPRKCHRGTLSQQPRHSPSHIYLIRRTALSVRLGERSAARYRLATLPSARGAGIGIDNVL